MTDHIIHKFSAPTHVAFDRKTIWSVRCSCGWSASAFDSASKLTPFVEQHLTDVEMQQRPGNHVNGVQVC